jgi:hypothetical protein
MCHAHGVTYRLSMAPRVAQRFGVHLRPHVIRLCAFFAQRIGFLLVVVGLLGVLGAIGIGPGQETFPVEVLRPDRATAADGALVDPATIRAGIAVDATSTPPGWTATVQLTGFEHGLLEARRHLVRVCVGLAALWGAFLLRAFADGNPFHDKNPGWLRRMAWAVLVATHVVPLLPPLALDLALHRLGVADDFGPWWGWLVHPSVLFVALLLLLAGALRQGRSLQDDVAGLV